MELQNFRNNNRHINHMNRGGDYQQQQQYQGDVSYNQYDDKISVGGLLGRQVYATNTIPPLTRGPAIAQTENENRS